MKKLLLLPLLGLMAGCVGDDDTSIPPYAPVIFLEDFESIQDGALVDVPGWGNIASQGSALWRGQAFNGNGYAELLSNGPTSAWLVSPPVALGNTPRKLSFVSAQHHLPPEGCRLDVLISTNYTGNIVTASWTHLEAFTAAPAEQWYRFVPSGEISMQNFSGSVVIAFRATMNAPGAAYFLDNVTIY